MIKKQAGDKDREGILGTLTRFGRGKVPPPSRQRRQALRAAQPEEPQVLHDLAGRDGAQGVARHLARDRQEPASSCRRSPEYAAHQVREADGGDVTAPPVRWLPVCQSPTSQPHKSVAVEPAVDIPARTKKWNSSREPPRLQFSDARLG